MFEKIISLSLFVSFFPLVDATPLDVKSNLINLMIPFYMINRLSMSGVDDVGSSRDQTLSTLFSSRSVLCYQLKGSSISCISGIDIGIVGQQKVQALDASFLSSNMKRSLSIVTPVVNLSNIL